MQPVLRCRSSPLPLGTPAEIVVFIFPKPSGPSAEAEEGTCGLKMLAVQYRCRVPKLDKYASSLGILLTSAGPGGFALQDFPSQDDPEWLSPGPPHGSCDRKFTLQPQRKMTNTTP